MSKKVIANKPGGVRSRNTTQISQPSVISKQQAKKMKFQSSPYEKLDLPEP